MATTSTPLMTWEAFERLPDGDGMHRELLEGELQILAPPKSGHSNIASTVFKALLIWETNGLGRVYAEAGYKLTEEPPTWIEPDVSFVRMERVLATADADYFLGAPDLAVEIVSPSESAKDLERKVELLLTGGSQAVWVLYPESQRVRVCLPGGVSFTRRMNDSVSAQKLFGDWEVPVAKLFRTAI